MAKAKAKNKNAVVIIELDKLRELRFGHKALKTFQAISDVKIEDIGSEGMDFDSIEKLIYCGLLSDARKNGETLTLEQVEDMLDDAPIQYVIDKMTEAMNLSFGGEGEVKEKN
jgi:hypothetical protein